MAGGSGTTVTGFPYHWQDEESQWVKIHDLIVEQQDPSKQPGNIIGIGEQFNYKLHLKFTPLLGRLDEGTEIKMGIWAMDISTGTVNSAYGFGINDHAFDLREVKAGVDDDENKVWDHTDSMFNFTANAPGGIYVLNCCVVVPATGISVFTYGPLLMVF